MSTTHSFYRIAHLQTTLNKKDSLQVPVFNFVQNTLKGFWSPLTKNGWALGRKLLRRNLYYIKWFEPWSISGSYSVIIWVRVVLKRTVVGE